MVGVKGWGPWESRDEVVEISGWWIQGLGRSRGGGGQGVVGVKGW